MLILLTTLLFLVVLRACVHELRIDALPGSEIHYTHPECTEDVR